MFERYTEPARQALFSARYEVSRLGGHRITPEHLLLGLLRQVDGVVAAIFAHAHIDAAALQNEIRVRCAGGDTLPASIEVPFAEESKRVLYRAASEADALGHGSIGPEHLVLALLSDGANPAADILLDHGVVVEHVRRQLAGTQEPGHSAK